jgi:hypothetical protein
MVVDCREYEIYLPPPGFTEKLLHCSLELIRDGLAHAAFLGNMLFLTILDGF